MAQVEIQAGPHRVVSLMSREAADELPAGARGAGHRRHQVHQRRRRAAGAAMTKPPHPDRARRGRRVGRVAGAPAGRHQPGHDPPLVGRRVALRGATGTVTVFAAASLQETFTTLAKQFDAAHPGVTVTPNFGASSALAQQIDQGRPPTCSRRPARPTWTRWSRPGERPRRRPSPRTSWRSPSRPANPAGIAASERSGQAGRQGRGLPGAGAVRRRRRGRSSPTRRSPSRRSARRRTSRRCSPRSAR